MTIYVRYRDDGPAKPCGQIVSITKPYDILYKCSDLEASDELIRKIRDNEARVRRNPRVDGVWSDNELDYYDPVKEYESSK